MKLSRTSVKSGNTSSVSAEGVRGDHPSAYIFCDQKTGAPRFVIRSDSAGDLPFDTAAGSLAVYCVAHYCSPSDLVLTVRAGEALWENIRVRAVALLESARVGVTSVALSPREREVLRAVTNNLCNKEIANQLSISVRTVKFHVSALLAKFAVSSRAQLSDFSTARMYEPKHGAAAPTRGQ